MTATTSSAMEALLPVADENAPITGQPLSAVEKTPDDDEKLRQISGRFAGFCNRFTDLFRGRTCKRKVPLFQYLKGLILGEKGNRNIEKICEKVPDADEQSLNHFISDSDWDERPVLDRIALEANKHLGGKSGSVLVFDESGTVKKGKKSVGVSRQWCGNVGKTENCQVNVFAALACDGQTTLIDERLYLPESWINDKERCKKAGIPDKNVVFKTKHELALESLCHARQIGVRFSWTGFDGFYGSNPEFLRAIDDMNEIFMADIHKDQRIWIEDPEPAVPPRKSNRGKAPSCPKPQSDPVRVDEFVNNQPENVWKRVKLRDSTKR